MVNRDNTKVGDIIFLNDIEDMSARKWLPCRVIKFNSSMVEVVWIQDTHQMNGGYFANRFITKDEYEAINGQYNNCDCKEFKEVNLYCGVAKVCIKCGELTK